MNIRSAVLLAQILCLSLMAGCDPGSTTRQVVQLRIDRAGSRESVSGATVHLKSPTVYDGEDWDAKWIRRPPVHCGLTDENGVTNIGIECDTIGHRQMRPVDFATGQTFVCEVSAEDWSDVLRIKLSRGESESGDDCTLTILAVGPPHFVRLRPEHP